MVKARVFTFSRTQLSYTETGGQLWLDRPLSHVWLNSPNDRQLWLGGPFTVNSLRVLLWKLGIVKEI